MKNIEVVAAIFIKEDKIFCAQRSNKGHLPFKWELPGGKVEEGESHNDALKREIYEELDTVIEVKDYYMTVKHHYKAFHLTMHAYFCEIIKGDLELKEHIDSCWLTAKQLDNLDWAAADIPIVRRLKKEIHL